jgi:hypothetical protein
MVVEESIEYFKLAKLSRHQIEIVKPVKFHFAFTLTSLPGIASLTVETGLQAFNMDLSLHRSHYVVAELSHPEIVSYLRISQLRIATWNGSRVACRPVPPPVGNIPKSGLASFCKTLPF